MIQKLYRQKWTKFIMYAVFAWLTAVSVSGVSGYRVTEINPVIPLLMLCAFYVSVQFAKKKEKGLCKSALWFSMPFSLTLVLGSGFDMDYRVFYGYSALAPLYFIVLSVFFMMLTVNGMVLLDGWTGTLAGVSCRYKKALKTGKSIRFPWLMAVLCCLIAWLPYYLTYYPGIVSPDYVEIINQCTGRLPLTNHHPILFVYFIKIILIPCERIGGMQTAAAVVTVIHMILFAVMLGYMAQWLYRKGIGKVGYGLTVAFIALNPVTALFSVYITKDVLFGGIFLLYVLKLYDIVESKGELLKTAGGAAGFLGCSLLVVFLRNNGIYIIFTVLVISIIMYRDLWKRLLVCIAIVILSYGSLKGPVFAMLGIEGESFAESLSVPLQQIAHTVYDDGRMTQEDAAFLEELMPLTTVKEVYTPGYTDPYKFHQDFDDVFLNAHKGEFLRVWADMLFRNPGSYVKAYLMQTAGYWHIGETDTLAPYGVTANELGITQCDLFKAVTGISLEPPIEKLILACRKAPVLCFVTNMAFMVFCVYFICIRCVVNGKKQYILPFLPLLLLWATVMIAAPAYCKFRYLFPYHLAYPFMLWVLLFRSGNVGTNRQLEEEMKD